MQPATSSQLTGTAPNQFAARRLAWLLGATAILVSATGFVVSIVYAVTSGDMSNILSHVMLNPFLTAIYALVGALVATRHPRNLIGWMFLTVAVIFALNIGAAAAGNVGLILSGDPQPGIVSFVAWLDNWFWLPGFVLPTVFVFLFFPDGRLLSPRWRLPFWAAALGLGAGIVGLGLHPGPLEAWGTKANPFGLAAAAPLLEPLLATVPWLLGSGFVGGIASFAIRIRRAEGFERKQMQWLLYAAVLLVVAHGAASFVWFGYPDSVLAADLTIVISSSTVMGIAVAAAIAILRYRLYDIDLLAHRTLVYGALTVTIIAIYVLVVGGLGWLFQAQGNPLIALLATGVVAVLFQPLRERLQRVLNRLFYGQRDDPLDALAQLGRRLEAAMAPDVVLPALVETIAQTLKLPYVAIAVRGVHGLEIAAETATVAAPSTSSQTDAAMLRLPLLYQGERLGQLLAAPRAPNEPFDADDRRLLEHVARQAGPALHVVLLTRALQSSRRQLVTTREEERRRLRRDLHDGLGAALAGMHLQAGILRRLIGSDPQKAEALVDEFRADIKATIDEIRRLVYELRPPTLDQLGLAAAVRAQAVQCSRATQMDAGGLHGDASLRVEVEAPEELPPLPAAVEVAALRIVQEALTNVVHHAQARHCRVRLEMNGELNVEVVDDGVGLPPAQNQRQGLGLLSMRERAVELGGSCSIEPVPGGGTRVVAQLPLKQETPPIVEGAVANE